MAMSSSSESDLEVLQLLSDWDTESDSDSSEDLRIRRERVNYMIELNDSEFIFRFRISKTAVRSLVTQIHPFLKTTSSRNNGIAPIHQLLLTLRFYALGTMLESVADYVGVSIPSACRIIGDVSKAIAHLYNSYIKIGNHTERQFNKIAGFPRVHGIIDSTHIHIQSPDSRHDREFRNNMRKFSLNVQAVCNADLSFINVDAQWPGSTHDATVFEKSVLRTQCESGVLENRWLLGNSAYPCRSYLLTPILKPKTRSEELYNEAHMKTHNTIDRCFEAWKRRFPVLSAKVRLALPKIQAIIIATAVLHNVCIKNGIPEVEPEVEIFTQQPAPVYKEGDYSQNRERIDLINTHFGRIQE